MSEKFTWEVSAPESQRMDQGRLDVWRESLAARRTTHLLVVRNGKIVYEWYVPDYGPDTKHFTASLGKALVGGTSLLLALSDGRIKADDPACKYIRAWRNDPEKQKITIRHLATHSAGIENAETPGKGHLDQGGWKEAFWRREPDPFTIARDQAPLIFEPGTRYAYSNPGMAMLAYAVTASLQKSPHEDIRSLLRERIMAPLGVPDSAWSIGYETEYPVDGLRLWGNWGGGEYTARAVAQIGLLMLRRGEWGGKQLVPAEWVDKVLSYGDTPLPEYDERDPTPAPGLGWWLNRNGALTSLPRDAFMGAGARHQALLVIPCLDIIVVRMGEWLGEATSFASFWGDFERYLARPLLNTIVDQTLADRVRAPYPPSSAIRQVHFDPPSTIVRKAFDSDNWPVTWADDDNLYTAYGDGRGFSPYTEQKLGLGFAKIVGLPTEFQGINVRSPSGENLGLGANGVKASGLLMVDGVLYMLVRNANNSQLAWSTDHGRSWNWANWRFVTSFGYPAFLNFGKNYTDARDDYVYVYSHDADSAYMSADHMVLARVPKERIRERGAYTFFVRLNADGAPIWSGDINDRGAVFESSGRCARSSISYNAGLKRYIWWQSGPRGGEGDVHFRGGFEVGVRFRGGFGIYDAPEPWGPWTTVYFTKEWDVGPGEAGCFPTNWMSADGQICYLVFSGNDYFSIRKVIFGS